MAISDVEFNQRSAFTIVLHRARDKRGQVINLADRTANCCFKINYRANVAFQLPVSTNGNGEVVLSGNTTNTDVPAGYYVYDVLLDDGNRIVTGVATVRPSVS